MNKIRKPAKKYHFMIGTTSRVPGSPGWHYQIFDIDDSGYPVGALKAAWPQAIFQRTKNGWHIYTPFKARLKDHLKFARKIGADPTWCRLAFERGWAFLADKSHVKIPWPVERKIIGWHTQTTQAQLNSFAQAKQKPKEKKECSRTLKIHSKKSAHSNT